ncbi:hypothetical protein PC121_g15556 [Phytophthora cactorum]|nr:hypothetical protein PC121_g15556 [Phytophthora cactorum]
MTTIESEAKRSGLWQAQQSVEDAVNVFASCASSIAVPRDTAKHRKRRQGQLRDNRSDSASCIISTVLQNPSNNNFEIHVTRATRCRGITRRTARKEFLARSRRAGSDGSHERLTHAHDEDFTPGGEVGADEEDASETDTPNVKPARKGGKAGRRLEKETRRRMQRHKKNQVAMAVTSGRALPKPMGHHAKGRSRHKRRETWRV